MVKSETVGEMTNDQKNEIVETMVGAMPSLNFDQAQAIIGNKGAFVADIGKVFKQHARRFVDFTIGDRTYELVTFFKERESPVSGDVMVRRAKELNANLGKKEGQFILKHQDEIPREFRGKFFLVFTAWRDPSYPRFVACLFWYDDRWFRYWAWLDDRLDEESRLVRRRPATNPA